MELNDALDESQSHPRSLAAGVQLVEETKNIIHKFTRNSHPIIADIKNLHTVARILLADLDAWRGLAAHKFGGVIDQVLHHLQDTLVVSKDGRQVFGNADRDISL